MKKTIRAIKISFGPFQKGDYLVDFGRVYEVFKIEKQAGGEGAERVIFFRPKYISMKNDGLICSIPEENLEKARIRKPMTKKDLKQLLAYLGEKPTKKPEGNVLFEKEKLKLNDPLETAGLIRRLANEKRDRGTSFTRSKNELLGLALRRLVEEVALVAGIDLEEAGNRIQAIFGEK